MKKRWRKNQIAKFECVLINLMRDSNTTFKFQFKGKGETNFQAIFFIANIVTFERTADICALLQKPRPE